MSIERPAITAQLRDTGVAAILRADRPDHLEAVAHELAAAGITCLELTLTTPGGLDALARLRRGLDAGVALGVGSVLDAAQAQAALDTGADFLVSPGVCEEAAIVAGTAEPLDAAMALEALGPRQVLIKLGGAGCLARIDGATHEVPAAGGRVPVLDTAEPVIR